MYRINDLNDLMWNRAWVPFIGNITATVGESLRKKVSSSISNPHPFEGVDQQSEDNWFKQLINEEKKHE